MAVLVRLSSLTYDYGCGCQDCQGSDCPRCDGSMSIREDGVMTDCSECEMVANIRTGECFMDAETWFREEGEAHDCLCDCAECRGGEWAANEQPYLSRA